MRIKRTESKVYQAPEFIEIMYFHFNEWFEMYYLYVKNGRFVTVIVSHRGVCFADICPRPHRVSVDTGQASVVSRKLLIDPANTPYVAAADRIIE